MYTGAGSLTEEFGYFEVTPAAIDDEDLLWEPDTVTWLPLLANDLEDTMDKAEVVSLIVLGGAEDDFLDIQHRV